MYVFHDSFSLLWLYYCEDEDSFQSWTLLFIVAWNCQHYYDATVVMRYTEWEAAAAEVAFACFFIGPEILSTYHESRSLFLLLFSSHYPPSFPPFFTLKHDIFFKFLNFSRHFPWFCTGFGKGDWKMERPETEWDLHFGICTCQQLHGRNHDGLPSEPSQIQTTFTTW